MSTLGFAEDELATLQKAFRSPQGMVLVTGPTGSGKTTTLHAGLGFINAPEVNIVTLEDPVEASIPGINHVQIAERGGVSFASGLRSILRQDPDVVFLGEMRDPEVSRIAVKAALTGHLVLSTLHTNSAAESLMRLADMGVPRYLVANALLMVVAQRLVRRVCDDCAEDSTVSDKERSEFRLDAGDIAGATPRVGRGCPSCYETGYRGRVAVYEILRLSATLREMIREDESVRVLVERARAEGMRSLFRAGIERVLKGETTFDEVRRRLNDGDV